MSRHHPPEVREDADELPEIYCVVITVFEERVDDAVLGTGGGDIIEGKLQQL